MKYRVGKSLLILLLLAAAGLPLYQLFSFFRGEDRGDAAYLLFEVAQFQMELLDSFMNEADGFKETRQLDPVKLSAYSANYAHERLIKATGQQALSLPSLSKFVEYINELQIGGQRGLREEERVLLQAMKGPIHNLYLAYEKLIDSNGRVSSLKQAELVKGNQELETFINGRGK